MKRKGLELDEELYRELGFGEQWEEQKAKLVEISARYKDSDKKATSAYVAGAGKEKHLQIKVNYHQRKKNDPVYREKRRAYMAKYRQQPKYREKKRIQRAEYKARKKAQRDGG